MKFALDLDSAFGVPHSYVLFFFLLSTSFLVCSSPHQHVPVYMYISTLYKAYHLNTIPNQHIILAQLVQKVALSGCVRKMSISNVDRNTEHSYTRSITVALSTFRQTLR